MKSILDLFKCSDSSLCSEDRFNYLRVFILKINLLRLSTEKYLYLTDIEGLKSLYILSHSHSVIAAFLKRCDSSSYCLQTINMRSEMRQDLKTLIYDSDTVTTSI